MKKILLALSAAPLFLAATLALALAAPSSRSASVPYDGCGQLVQYTDELTDPDTGRTWFVTTPATVTGWVTMTGSDSFQLRDTGGTTFTGTVNATGGFVATAVFGPDASGILMYTADGYMSAVLMRRDRYLLAQHTSQRAENRGKWGLPGGRLKDAEKPKACLRRELIEDLAEAAPDSWRAWFRLALAYDAAGDRTRARAAARQALVDPPQIDAAITRAGRVAGFSADGASTTTAAARLDVPLLIIHGEKDGRIPAEHARRIAEAASGRATHRTGTAGTPVS